MKERVCGNIPIPSVNPKEIWEKIVWSEPRIKRSLSLLRPEPFQTGIDSLAGEPVFLAENLHHFIAIRRTRYNLVILGNFRMQEILHQLLRLGGVFCLRNPLRKISGADNLQRSLWTDTGNAGFAEK